MNSINVAIIGGAGFMGKAHSFAWSMAAVEGPAGVELNRLVLVEPDAAVAEATARALGWRQWATDWREVVDRDDIHVIDIVTPPHTHAEIAEYALSRGKHVLCEKPLANSPAETKALVELSGKPGVTSQVGFNYRHNPALQLARELIHQGAIGTVIQARFDYLQDVGFGDLGWRTKKRTGGSGASGDIGSHIVDLAQLLVGRIDKVAALLDIVRMSGDDDHDVDDAGSFLARFDTGAHGVFSFSQKSWGQNNHIRVEIDGTLGALAFDWNRRDELQVCIGADRTAGLKGFRTVHVDGSTPGTWFALNGAGTGYLESSANQILAFVANIVDGTPNGPSFSEGANVQSVIDAVWASASDNSRWVSVEGSIR